MTAASSAVRRQFFSFSVTCGQQQHISRHVSFEILPFCASGAQRSQLKNSSLGGALQLRSNFGDSSPETFSKVTQHKYPDLQRAQVPSIIPKYTICSSLKATLHCCDPPPEGLAFARRLLHSKSSRVKKKNYNGTALDAATLEEDLEENSAMAGVTLAEAGNILTPSVNVVVRDKASLERKKQAIREAGPSRLQVIADFDMTLTRFMIDGKKGQSCHSLLSQKDDRYNQVRQELYKYYYPLEIDQSIPYDEKVELMKEWYTKSHATLLEGGLTSDEIRNSVRSANVAFREGTTQLFELLDSKRVPVLIFSAGLADVLEEILRQKLHRAFGNIRVVSNRMNFDESGRLESFVGELIHSLNKNEHAIALAGPMHDEQGRVLDDLEHSEPSNGAAASLIDGWDGPSVVAGRNNVILMGDHLGDLGMSRGVKVDEQISIGFLNDKVDANFEAFTKSFDVVLLGDGSMEEVISIVREILAA